MYQPEYFIDTSTRYTTKTSFTCNRQISLDVSPTPTSQKVPTPYLNKQSRGQHFYVCERESQGSRRDLSLVQWRVRTCNRVEGLTGRPEVRRDFQAQGVTPVSIDNWYGQSSTVRRRILGSQIRVARILFWVWELVSDCTDCQSTRPGGMDRRRLEKRTVRFQQVRAESWRHECRDDRRKGDLETIDRKNGESRVASPEEGVSQLRLGEEERSATR